MTDTGVIDRFAIRWRLSARPGSTPPVPDGERFDRLVARLLDGPLEGALLGLGLGRGEEACLRRVAVPPVLARWEDSDAAIVEGWSRAIGDAVGSALAEAARDMESPDVVRYRSLDHARVDLAVRALAGDLARAWAWRQLGLWPDGLPVPAPGDRPGPGPAPPLVAGHAAAVVAAAPHLVVPVFVGLADRDELPAALAALGAAGTVELASGGWAAIGGSRAAVAVAAAGMPGELPAALGVVPGPEPAGEPVAGPPSRLDAAARIVRRSRIAAAIAGRGHQPPGVAAALAALAVAEAEPGAARGAAGPDGDPARLVAAVAVALAPGAPGPPRPSIGTGSGEAGTAVAAGAAGPGAAGAPDAGAAPATAGSAAGREPATTSWGGLLFLVHVVEALGVPDRLLAADTSGAGFRAALHALGTALLARAAPPDEPLVAPTDPALLAFCGLPPDALPPEADDEPATATAGGGEGGTGPATPAARRAAVVEREADAIVAEVAHRLPGLGAASRAEAASRTARDGRAGQVDGGRLLAAVCRRRAEVVADPGWVEVVLDLDGVLTEVRRAGLDLDPGWVPWLGVVVRFRYA